MLSAMLLHCVYRFHITDSVSNALLVYVHVTFLLRSLLLLEKQADYYLLKLPRRSISSTKILGYRCLYKHKHKLNIVIEGYTLLVFKILPYTSRTFMMGNVKVIIYNLRIAFQKHEILITLIKFKQV